MAKLPLVLCSGENYNLFTGRLSVSKCLISDRYSAEEVKKIYWSNHDKYVGSWFSYWSQTISDPAVPDGHFRSSIPICKVAKMAPFLFEN